MYLGKVDTYRKQEGWMHGKTYSGRIKPTKGLFNLRDPKVKAISHRIVRTKLKREMAKEINNP